MKLFEAHKWGVKSRLAAYQDLQCELQLGTQLTDQEIQKNDDIDHAWQQELDEHDAELERYDG